MSDDAAVTGLDDPDDEVPESKVDNRSEHDKRSEETVRCLAKAFGGVIREFVQMCDARGDDLLVELRSCESDMLRELIQSLSYGVTPSEVVQKYACSPHLGPTHPTHVPFGDRASYWICHAIVTDDVDFAEWIIRTVGGHPRGLAGLSDLINVACSRKRIRMANWLANIDHPSLLDAYDLGMPEVRAFIVERIECLTEADTWWLLGGVQPCDQVARVVKRFPGARPIDVIRASWPSMVYDSEEQVAAFFEVAGDMWMRDEFAEDRAKLLQDIYSDDRRAFLRGLFESRKK